MRAVHAHRDADRSTAMVRVVQTVRAQLARLPHQPHVAGGFRSAVRALDAGDAFVLFEVPCLLL
jgi:hypothetical protein